MGSQVAVTSWRDSATLLCDLSVPDRWWNSLNCLFCEPFTLTLETLEFWTIIFYFGFTASKTIQACFLFCFFFFWLKSYAFFFFGTTLVDNSNILYHMHFFEFEYRFHQNGWEVRFKLKLNRTWYCVVFFLISKQMY